MAWPLHIEGWKGYDPDFDGHTESFSESLSSCSPSISRTSSKENVYSGLLLFDEPISEGKQLYGKSDILGSARDVDEKPRAAATVLVAALWRCPHIHQWSKIQGASSVLAKVARRAVYRRKWLFTCNSGRTLSAFVKRIFLIVKLNVSIFLIFPSFTYGRIILFYCAVSARSSICVTCCCPTLCCSAAQYFMQKDDASNSGLRGKCAPCFDGSESFAAIDDVAQFQKISCHSSMCSTTNGLRRRQKYPKRT